MIATVSVTLLFVPIASSLSNFPIVRTSYGTVRGYEHRAKNGFVGEIFKKIPYAAPPIGSRRWRKPEPPSAWNYTLDGTFFGPACAQVSKVWKGYVTGFSEDCLTLNIYSSQQCRESNASCPVVFYIHGGGMFASGPHTFLDEVLVTNFARQGVILVTSAFRLGVFGVMALGDEDVLPANLGMHDVLQSLRFIRQEIHAFGGNKDQITLMGESSGGTMVLAFMFSPVFNKPGEPPLFARAIAMSSTMSFEKEEKQIDISHKITEKLNCRGSAREILDCLKLLSTDQIIKAAEEIAGSNIFSLTQLCGLTLAGELMPIHNMKELRDQHEKQSSTSNTQPIELLIGTLITEFGTDVSVAGDRRVQSLDVLGVQNSEECIEKYWEDVESGQFDPGYETMSQGIFLSTSLFAPAHQRTGAKVYVYQLDYPPHALHSKDLYYILGMHEFEMDENEKWIGRVYPMYFTNFIKGLPLAPDWVEFDPALMNYYSINKSLTDGVSPGMKYGYHRDLTNYYDGMKEYDDQFSRFNKMHFNQPIQTRNLILRPTEALNFRAVLCYIIIIFVALFVIFKLYRGRRYSRASTQPLLKYSS